MTWVPEPGAARDDLRRLRPAGARGSALAVSPDLRHWRRLGPVLFGFQPELDTDLGLFPNKDAVFFPEPVPGPDGEPSYALLHRPMWDLSWIRPRRDGATCRPALTDPRPGIWISYVPVAEVAADLTALSLARPAPAGRAPAASPTSS